MGRAGSIENHLSLRLLKFFMKTTGMWPVENTYEKLISDLALLYTTTIMAVGVIAQGIEFYHSLGNLHTMVDNIPIIICGVVVFVKLCKFIINRSEMMDFNAYIEKNFWKVEYNMEECQILDVCNRKSMRMVITHFFFTQSVVFFFASTPIAETSGMNISERMLPINIYFDFPFTESPYYEITFFLEIAAGMAVGLCTTTFTTYVSTTNFYVAGQFEILQRRLERAFSTVESIGVDESSITMKISPNFSNVRECIKQHQLLILHMERMEKLFSMILLTQTLGSVLLLSFCGFQIVLGGVKTSLFRFLLSVEFLIVVSVNLLSFAWPCQEIIAESQKVAEGAYQTLWYCLPYTKEGRLCRQSMIIVIMRARKPCELTVLRTALSYFTVLRQMNEENNG